MAGMGFILLIFMVASVVIASLPMEPPQLRLGVLTTHIAATVAGVVWLFVPDGDSGTIPLAIAIFGPGAAIAIVRIVRTRYDVGQRQRNHNTSYDS